MRSHALFGILLAAFGATAALAADHYSVNVTRKDRNLYRVDGTHIWVQTRYCYTYGYGEAAALNSDELVFLDSDDKCDVKRVLKETNVSAGTYNVRLTQEDDDLYSTMDGTFIKTTMCLSLALGEETVLRLNGYGGGTAIFLNNNQRCQVEAVFTTTRL